jgi:uncharacterized surface protein with fasciclin (FAS1) repeats
MRFNISSLVTSLSIGALIIAAPATAAEKKAKKAATDVSQQASPPTAESTTAPADTAPLADTSAPPSAAGPAPSSGPTPDATQISAGKSVIENASNSPDHTTLVAAVKSAGLAETLSGPGPFTVFAPTNAGFGRLPPGTVDALLKPENQGSLAKILKGHVVAGKMTAADLAKKIKAGKGKAVVTTLSGDTLTATTDGTAVKLTDGNGNASDVTQADITSSNGIIHAINGVLIPSEKKATAPAR